MPHARGGAWARKTARERWSIRRCGSIRPSRGPSICGPGAPRRADFHRLASINMETANEELSSASACRNPNGREDSSAFPTSPQGGDGLPRPTRGRIWHGDSVGRRAARRGGGRPPSPVTTEQRRDRDLPRRRNRSDDPRAPRLPREETGRHGRHGRGALHLQRRGRDGPGDRRRAPDRERPAPRWPGRKRARRSRRSITSATRSGGSAKRSPDVPRLRAVLFDIDGTLLDTRDAWVAAFDAGLAAIRKASISGSEAAQWIGTPIEVIYAERCGLAGDELTMAVREFQRVEAASVHEGMRAYPGIREALASLVAWKLATVSNKRRDTSVEALRATGLLPFFAVVLGGDSVPRKKPAPDPILKAASALGVQPTECAVVGDTEVDVRAGKAAGARTIGVTWGYGTRARLEDAGVDYLIETPDALPPLLRALTPSTAA